MAESGREVRAAAGTFLTFRLGGQLYGLPAGEVAEVIRTPLLARLPQSPPGLLGLANLRGTVLPVASLRGLLGQGAAGPDGNGRAIVLDGAAPVALVVDTVDALLAPAPATIDTTPAALAAEPGEVLRAAFPARAGIVKVLDAAALLARALAPAAAAPARRANGRTGAGSPTVPAANTAQRSLLTFAVAGQEYALELDCIQAIMPAPGDLATVPRADAAVLGLAGLRDALLPVLSLRALLGHAAAETRSGGEKVIVALVAGQPVGLMADRVLAVLRVDAATIEAAPPLLAARAGGEARMAAVHRRPGGGRPIPILAPDQLFRNDVMQRLTERQAKTAEKPAAGSRDEKAFLVFRLGEEEYGLPIEAVAEVAAAPDQVTRVPRTPKFLAGVVNLRGDVLPVIDQRQRFELGPAPDPRRRRLVVLRTARCRAALLVDSVRQVLRLPGEAIGPAPDIAQEAGRLIVGVANLEHDGRLVLLLDPDELLSRTEQRLLDNFSASRSPR